MTLVTLIEAFRVLSAQLAAFEALLLLVSAVHKLVKWSRSRGVLRQFAGVPASLTALVLAVVCTAEFVRNGVLLGFAMLVVAVCIWSGSDKVQGSQVLAAFALLALYGALDQVMALRPLRGGEVL
jgi:hypothetical protein